MAKISAVLLMVGLVIGLAIGYGAGSVVSQSEISEIQSDLSKAQSRATSLESVFQALSVGLIEVKVGQEFNITLNSNPTTGYQWQLAKRLNETILQLVGSVYKPSGSGLIGSGGTEIWTFKAVSSGTAGISLKYVRPWETDVPPIEAQSFGVIVGN